MVESLRPGTDAGAGGVGVVLVLVRWWCGVCAGAGVRGGGGVCDPAAREFTSCTHIFIYIYI